MAAISFTLNGELRQESSVSPTMTALDFLRENAGLTGTKEGCAEGDCGACTIVMVRNGADRLEAVMACLLVVGQLDGAQVVTVEGLTERGGELESVQQAIVTQDGTQCGFCTPGFVMALYALRHSGETVTDEVIHDALAGNLCRCTGYRSIVDAARTACSVSGKDNINSRDDSNTLPASDAYEAGGQLYFAPKTIDALIARRVEYPDAPLLSGGTDLGLLFSKERQKFPVTIYTQNVDELRRIEEDDTSFTIGAAATYTEALPYIEAEYASFGVLIRRIGSRQIRNVGTIGGNIGNASPIGDTPPCLIALDSVLTLRGPNGAREISLEDFFLDYRKTDLAKDEIIENVRVPKLGNEQIFRTYKISKRYDQDISSVIGAFRLTLENGVVTAARIAFGGMAAVPKRAIGCEAALTGAVWSEDAVRQAAAAIEEDFSPIDDHRASAAYRLRVAANLFVRLYRDVEGADDVEVMAL
ncbi:MAG: xanthine dehydrogenase small subunit [Alphaproteobacteria bacterium]|nr:xanthine dehydrogenase small subunit [Alphaproteobacteria bacterium]